MTSVQDGLGLVGFGLEHRGNLAERGEAEGTTAGYAYDEEGRIAGVHTLILPKAG